MAISPHQKFILSIGAASLISLFIGWQLGKNDLSIQYDSFIPSIRIRDRQPERFSKVDMAEFWNVWDIVSSRYVEREKLDPQKMIQGATSGILSALDDPYSVYLTPKQNVEAKADLEGTFEGVGMQLGYNKDKQLVVIAPINDSPADKAGIRAGDKIWKINDKETPGMSIPQAVELIRGEKGTKVKLTTQRGELGELSELEITRDTIYVKSVEVSYKENDSIAHVKINRFGDSTEAEWDQSVSEITKKNVKKIILDVRNNPGGYLNTAVHINSDFLTGTVMQQEDYKGNKTPFKATHNGRLLDAQVVGLINKGSASASEIVAGGLQDRGKAKLVGEQSFGKGTIQEVIDLSKGAGLHITSAKWLLPSGKWIHKEGLKPDYEVKIEEQDFSSDKDPQLDKAVELLK